MIGQTLRLVGALSILKAKELIDKAPHGAVVNIRPATRTSDQNAKMHAMLSDIARAKPDGREMTTDQWKAAFMDACGFKPTFIPSLEGDSFLCLGFKSSRLTKAEFSDLIECIYEFGARKGVEWSEPEQTTRAA
jgi:hypothetical protein